MKSSSILWPVNPMLEKDVLQRVVWWSFVACQPLGKVPSAELCWTTVPKQACAQSCFTKLKHSISMYDSLGVTLLQSLG